MPCIILTTVCPPSADWPGELDAEWQRLAGRSPTRQKISGALAILGLSSSGSSSDTYVQSEEPGRVLGLEVCLGRVARVGFHSASLRNQNDRSRDTNPPRSAEYGAAARCARFSSLHRQRCSLRLRRPHICRGRCITVSYKTLEADEPPRWPYINARDTVSIPGPRILIDKQQPPTITHN